MSEQTETTYVDALTKSSPSVLVTGLTLGGFSLNEWVLILTLVYTLLQTYFLVRDKAYRPWKERRDAARLAKLG
jgi:antibiotic biosynthesis monooxygenase (ABM) superfamily enzyme